MECRDYKEQFTQLLTNSLDQKKLVDIENHLAVCMDCCQEFETAKKIWEIMGKIPVPEPSSSMTTEFNAILADFRREKEVKMSPAAVWLNKLREFWFVQGQPRLAFSMLLVALGLAGGYFLHQPGQQSVSYNRQIDSLSSQVSEMKQMMMFSLLKDPSASQRIKAVAYTEEISNVNIKVIDALFTTLNEDPNVNVRLATLDALVRLSGEPRVREGLVRSISLQESPLLQSAIADVMVKLQEKSSVQSLQKLLDKKDLNKMVKQNIEKSILQLI